MIRNVVWSVRVDYYGLVLILLFSTFLSSILVFYWFLFRFFIISHVIVVIVVVVVLRVERLELLQRSVWRFDLRIIESLIDFWNSFGFWFGMLLLLLILLIFPFNCGGHTRTAIGTSHIIVIILSWRRCEEILYFFRFRKAGRLHVLVKFFVGLQQDSLLFIFPFFMLFLLQLFEILHHFLLLSFELFLLFFPHFVNFNNIFFSLLVVELLQIGFVQQMVDLLSLLTDIFLGSILPVIIIRTAFLIALLLWLIFLNLLLGRKRDNILVVIGILRWLQLQEGFLVVFKLLSLLFFFLVFYNLFCTNSFRIFVQTVLSGRRNSFRVFISNNDFFFHFFLYFVIVQLIQNIAIIIFLIVVEITTLLLQLLLMLRRVLHHRVRKRRHKFVFL